MLAMILAAMIADPAPVQVKYVESVGELLEPAEKGQNYRLKVKDEVFHLAFDDKYERWPELKKELPKMVGKQVVVKHREGFVQFGKEKVLLSRDAKVK